MARDEMPLFTSVDDETYAELSELMGQRVVHIAVWEDALDEALADSAAGVTPEIAPETAPETAPATAQQSFDIDVYLEDGAYFELYSVDCFDAPDSEPWVGYAHVAQRLADLVSRKCTLSEVAVDEDDCLVLVLGKGKEQIFLAVGAWLLEEWDELPGD